MRAETGLDLDARPNAIRETVWSAAVQHGGARRPLNDAVRAADKVEPDRGSARYDKVLDLIYDRRSHYVGERAANAREPGYGQTLCNVQNNRLPAERAEAIERARVSTFRNDPVQDCMITAAGRVDERGNGAFRAIGDEGEFMLRTGTGGEIKIDPSPRWPENLACFGTVVGTYRPTERPAYR